MYFFSQAINVEEAREEAAFVLQQLREAGVTKLALPVAFDLEPSPDYSGRADNLSPAETNAIARAFCTTIQEAGYRVIVYGNKVDLNRFDLVSLDEPIEQKVLDLFQLAPHVSYAAQVSIPGAAPQVTNDVLSGAFDNGADLLARCSKTGASIGQIMRQREKDLRPDADVDAEMAHVLEIMRDEVHDTIKTPRQSIGGLLNGQAKTVANTPAAISSALMGTTQTRAVAYAMAVLERSATMGVIVAAPTAGASGVVPGSLISVAEEIGATDEQVISALWNASAIGAILTTNASVSGAEGGCQAEVGSAAAMSASALTELLGGTPQQCLDAASIAISNLLGLVCDPVRGLVEYPCQDRNAIGVAAAVSSSQLALAGVGNPIPFDEVAHAMAEVGAALPVSLRETAKGGLAATPSAPTACASCTGCAPLDQAFQAVSDIVAA